MKKINIFSVLGVIVATMVVTPSALFAQQGLSPSSDAMVITITDEADAIHAKMQALLAEANTLDKTDPKNEARLTEIGKELKSLEDKLDKLNNQ